MDWFLYDEGTLVVNGLKVCNGPGNASGCKRDFRIIRCFDLGTFYSFIDLQFAVFSVYHPSPPLLPPLILKILFPNISRSKGNQAVKFGQLRECNMWNIFLGKSYTNVVEKLFPSPFMKNKTEHIFGSIV